MGVSGLWLVPRSSDDAEYELLGQMCFLLGGDGLLCQPIRQNDDELCDGMRSSCRDRGRADVGELQQLLQLEPEVKSHLRYGAQEAILQTG